MDKNVLNNLPDISIRLDKKQLINQLRAIGVKTMFMMNCLYEDNTRVMGTGKGHQMLFKDLTTLQGVLNRIKRYNLNDNKAFIIQQGQTVYDLKIIYTHRGKIND